MGWGWEPHEGYRLRPQMADARVTSDSATGTSDSGVYVAACSCGWQGDGCYPADDDGHDQVGHEWHYRHWLPLVTPPEHQRLIRGTDGGGERDFLDGRAVHCGQPLELLVAGGQWIRVRYETSLGEGVAYMVLGGPGERFDATDRVHFPLPGDAVLRWPQ